MDSRKFFFTFQEAKVNSDLKVKKYISTKNT